jgi:hypothetical protein
MKMNIIYNMKISKFVNLFVGKNKHGSASTHLFLQDETSSCSLNFILGLFLERIKFHYNVFEMVLDTVYVFYRLVCNLR